jgi:HlyD family secretion protein
MQTLPSIGLRSPWAIALCLAMTGLAGCGGGESVEVIQPRRGTMEESFREPARTRLARTWAITMPFAGRIGRIELEPGDRVTAGQELAVFDRVPLEERATEVRAVVAELEAAIRLNEYHDLELTMLDEIKIAIEAAQETLKASRAEVGAQKARSERADKTRERFRKLGEDVSRSELDDAELLAETSLIELRSREFSLAANEAVLTIIQLGPTWVEKWMGRKHLQRDELVHRLAQARARQAVAEHELSLAHLRSPIEGVVLARHEQGDAALLAGHPLLELGDLDELEIVAEVLTEDAQFLSIDSPVTIEAAAFEQPIPCRIERIEPAGFTKLSSLGIEQQRVTVIVAFPAPPPRLGVGYRVRARFLTGRREDAVVVPRASVLQAPGGSYFVFRLDGDRLRRQEVELGLTSDLELEITAGLDSSARIVAAPDVNMQEGDRIHVRE